jgi:hypothetical protein
MGAPGLCFETWESTNADTGLLRLEIQYDQGCLSIHGFIMIGTVK